MGTGIAKVPFLVLNSPEMLVWSGWSGELLREWGIAEGFGDSQCSALPTRVQASGFVLDSPSLPPSANIPNLFEPGTGKGMSQPPNLPLIPSF